ncbi:MAG: hypothetical protein H7Y11_13130 [Armatimonadetes bacterium]|nr:hypothetical protein [Anaerolineae bacterium]
MSFDVVESFEAALRAFPGAVLVATHDRRFLQNFGGALWQVQDGRISVTQSDNVNAPLHSA